MMTDRLIGQRYSDNQRGAPELVGGPMHRISEDELVGGDFYEGAPGGETPRDEEGEAVCAAHGDHDCSGSCAPPLGRRALHVYRE